MENSTNSVSPDGSVDTLPTAPDSTPAEVMAHPGGGGFPDQDRSAAAEALIEKGVITREQAEQMLSCYTESGELIETEAVRDDLDPDAIEIRRAFPVAKPEEYVMPRTLDLEEQMSPEYHHAESTFRAMLTKAEFSKEMGSALSQTMSDVSDRHEQMTDVDKELWKRSEAELLRRVWGDELQANLALAKQLVDEWDRKSPGIWDFMVDTGAANSSSVIHQLAQHAQRLEVKNRDRDRATLQRK